MNLGDILYGVTSKGQIKTWRCSVYADRTLPIIGPATLVINTQTKLGGKIVTREDIITEGKNIGKSNETTPFEQATKEAESRYRKQLKKGYSLTMPTDTSKADCNSLGLPKPMLAHPVDKVKNLEFPAYVQPKLDGHRAIVTRKDGKMMMYSRGGDEITSMNHILEYLSSRVKEGVFLDGELYIHRQRLQDIGSWIRKYQKGYSEFVEYHIYDIMLDKPYKDRLTELDILINEDPVTAKHPPVVRVPRYPVPSLEDAMNFRNDFISDGYEGAMLRMPDKGYQAGKKSRTLLKLKKFDDSEYTIIDVVEGKDRIVNNLSLKVAIFVCKTPEGKTFEVTAHGDMYDKHEAWQFRKNFIGKPLTVQHSGYTKDNIPWHPVALRIREDI